MRAYFRRSKHRLRLAWTYDLPTLLRKDLSGGEPMERTAEIPVTRICGVEIAGVFMGFMLVDKRGVTTRDHSPMEEDAFG